MSMTARLAANSHEIQWHRQPGVSTGIFLTLAFLENVQLGSGPGAWGSERIVPAQASDANVATKPRQTIGVCIL